MQIKQAPRFGNLLSRIAAGFTRSASRHTPARRWVILLTLLGLWLVAGFITWSGEHLGPFNAAYRTLGALAMTDIYTDVREGDWLKESARFAGVAIPLVGLLFAFSGSLARSLARAFNAGAAKHVVIAGSSAGALSLAHDCLKERDSVILIARGLAEETVLLLGQRGGFVIEGDATRAETLRGARAHKAAHVVAFEKDEAANLQIEALMRLVARRADAGARPIAVHVSTTSPALLQEAREMRSQEQKKREETNAGPAQIDARPFSLDEIAARALVQDQAMTLLSLAKALKQAQPHVVFFGFDEAAEAVAVRMLMSLWSVHFAPPRVTVLARDAATLERRFQARHPNAFAHAGLWTADIVFQEFDWRERKLDREVLADVANFRDQGTAIVVSTGDDSDNIILALSLKRTCNEDKFWPVPIFMKETTRSEFSLQYARGDDTPELDAYLQAFGAGQLTATRQRILEGRLDAGAAIHHQHYQLTMKHKDKEGVPMRDLQAVAKDWDEVLETYRDANRAGADAVMVRMFDAGWRAAAKTERDGAIPEAAIQDDMMARMARREHDRWMAERLMNGWRPGEKRNNTLRVHPNLTPWDNLTKEEQDRDAEQIKAAMQVGQMLSPHGFMLRGDAVVPPNQT